MKREKELQGSLSSMRARRNRCRFLVRSIPLSRARGFIRICTDTKINVVVKPARLSTAMRISVSALVTPTT